MPAEEVDRILNCLPSPQPEKDWKLDNAAVALQIDVTTKIPASKDLREKWWTIADQGGTGSCVGWATADSVLRWHFVRRKRIPKDCLLSVRFIWMASKELDESTSMATTFIERSGTFLKAALDVARTFGCVLDSVLPFESPQMYLFDENTFYLTAAQLKINSYVRLEGPDQWRRWIATRGPVLTRLNVDATWSNATQTGGALEVYQPDTARGGHAVALVGYSPERFTVRNSWGEEWGDGGFAYASEAYAQAAFTEAYGVIV